MLAPAAGKIQEQRVAGTQKIPADPEDEARARNGAFNDIDQPDAVAIETRQPGVAGRSNFSVDCPAHSVSVLSLE